MKRSISILLMIMCATLLMQEASAGRNILADVPNPEVDTGPWLHLPSLPTLPPLPPLPVLPPLPPLPQINLPPLPPLPPWLQPLIPVPNPPVSAVPKQSPPSQSSPPPMHPPTTPSTSPAPQPSTPVSASPTQPPSSQTSPPAWEPPTVQDFEKCLVALLQSVPQCAIEALNTFLYGGDSDHVNQDCCTAIATIVHCSSLNAHGPLPKCGSSP